MEPKYLTTQDLAYLIGITPQMIRKKCARGDIEGAYKMSGKGSWRIDPEFYRNHPRYQQLLKNKIEEKMASNDTVQLFKNLINNPIENNEDKNKHF